jgi:predicted metal-binding protein
VHCMHITQSECSITEQAYECFVEYIEIIPYVSCVASIRARLIYNEIKTLRTGDAELRF